MTNAQQQNYTTEQTTELLKLYEELGTDGLEEIAERLQKPVRSVRSKLVKEGVYIPIPKSNTRKLGRSKKDMLNELETMVGFDTTGFNGSTKSAISNLIAYLAANNDIHD
jgi:hypothetical protein